MSNDRRANDRRTIEGTACAAGTLRRAARSLTRLFDAHLARAGLTTTQFSILRTLQRRHGRMPLAEMAADLVFERTSLYRALGPLRRAGLVSVRRGADRRVKEVELTARAHRSIAEAMPHWAAAQRAVLDRFGRGSWPELAARLNRLTAVAGSVHPK
jgi:DNA-binding MarR family transcriptional regulator